MHKKDRLRLGIAIVSTTDLLCIERHIEIEKMTVIMTPSCQSMHEKGNLTSHGVGVADTSGTAG